MEVSQVPLNTVHGGPTSVADAYRQHVKEAVCEAVATERERCAKVIESWICDGLSFEDKALARAAAEIRKEPK
jgi:hypothetical protein